MGVETTMQKFQILPPPPTRVNFLGWCYTDGKSTVGDLNSVLADVLSYEFWAFLCFILLTVLYISLFFSMYLKCKVRIKK